MHYHSSLLQYVKCKCAINDNEQTGAMDPLIPSAPELFVLLTT